VLDYANVLVKVVVILGVINRVPAAVPDLPIGYISLGLGPEDPRGLQKLWYA